MNTPSSSSSMGETPEASQSSRLSSKASRRREKPQLSCNPCRRRKLRCDRGQPCETCARGGVSLSCTYAPTSDSELLKRPQSSAPAHTNMHGRIDQLEALVTSLMDSLNKTRSSAQWSGSCDSPEPLAAFATPQADAARLQDGSSQLADSFGRISLENAETSYVESAHWTAILDEIAELKDYFENQNDSTEQRPPATETLDASSPELLFGYHKRLTKEEILAAVPARPFADRLIATYFGFMDMAPLIIHSPTFLREYERFWEDPMQVSIMWLGLLFAIMCSGAVFQQLSSNGAAQSFDSRHLPDCQRPVETYREKVIQCLLLGEYMKCGPHTMETLIVYLFVEYSRSEDARVEVWILLGVVVRLALRMGYHRDTSQSPRISPFRGEMRRRNWAIIFQLDMLASTQFGLPRMIRETQSDTAEPRNLREEDLDEHLLALPPARPETDLSPVLFAVVKNRLVSVICTTVDFTTSTGPSSYAEVINLDKRLQDTYDAIPADLQWRSMAKSIMDASALIFARITLVVLLHKAQCILHRKHLLLARTDSRYTYSRNACVEAALKLLELQTIVYQETQLGGRLHQCRWKAAPIVKQEFLLATTILCLEVHHDTTTPLPREPQQYPLDAHLKGRVIESLNGSYRIWLASSGSSREAQKVALALRTVLSKAQNMQSTPAASNSIGIDNPAWNRPTVPVDRSIPPGTLPHSFQPGTSTTAYATHPAKDPVGVENWTPENQLQSIDEYFDMSEWVEMARFVTENSLM